MSYLCSENNIQHYPDIMIYYFSGTHNSRYAALRLGSLTGQKVLFIPDTDPYTQTLPDDTDESTGFVFPVYAWGVPPIVLDFIRHLPEKMTAGMRHTWCVATCGDETGMAVEMLRKELLGRGVELSCAWSLIMPNVYVLLPGFGTDSKELEEKKLREAVGRLEEIAERILSRERGVFDVHLGPIPRIKTAIVYPLFKKFGVNTRKWHYTDACISCGKCAEACPVGNIAMTDGHPRWGSDCTSCCACYHVCPTRAAQYGTVTRKAGQYYNRSQS